MLPPEPDQPSVGGEDGARVRVLRRDRPPVGVGRHPDPWPPGGEPAVGTSPTPRHRGAGGVAVPPRDQGPGQAPTTLRRRVDDLRPRHLHVTSGDLLPVVEERRAAERQAQDRRCTGDRVAVRDGILRARRQAAHVSRLVVVRQHDGRPPPRGEDLLVLLAGPGEGLRLPRLADQQEVEREVARGREGGRGPIVRREHLADRHPARKAVDHRPELGKEVQQLGPILVVQVLLSRIRAPSEPLRWRVRQQLLVLEERVEHVEPEAIDTTLEPGPRHAQHLGTDGGVPPVQVRLLGQEGVHVVLAADVVPLPCGAAEERHPVVRPGSSRAPRRRVAPDVPVAGRPRAVAPRVLEPAMG